jgi:hypothetical protein
MKKRDKNVNPLPKPLGLELKRQRPADAAGFDMFDDTGRVVVQAFYEKHKTLFQDLQAVVDLYILTGDGDSLLLMDAALLGACQRIRDHIGAAGVQVVGDAVKH